MVEKTQRTYQQDIVGDGISSIQKVSSAFGRGNH